MKAFADELRMRRLLRAESAIAKAGIKILFPMIIFCPTGHIGNTSIRSHG